MAITAPGRLWLYDSFMAVGNCSLPTIVAVKGGAVGASLNLAPAAGVRIAGPTALFNIPLQKRELHLGGGVSWTPHRIPYGGPQVARAAFLCGMHFDHKSTVRYGLTLSVADAIPSVRPFELAPKPAATPRRAALTNQGHYVHHRPQPKVARQRTTRTAERLEFGPQTKSVQSTKFVARLAATQRR
ncbi:enoyl-CoA hydratase [Mycobacterium lepromatosis]|uniref:enoyl-CoA hydratase n=1 Tax=Mycobacterium lepromatosis TaxID=480418 RepID=UPI0012E01445|nr:enoyl-CoA hydratase [Mycobacterium lepromatosis]UKN41780.1 enoyl-CoA hydratase [Mycobacterium lepromatosis]